MRNITRSEANRLYKTMKDIHDLFTKHNIAYWITGGSLIGAIRHRGIIPWDDDGDVCIMKKDVSKLQKLIPRFEHLGYHIEEGVESDSDSEEIQMCRAKRNSCTWYLEHKSKNSLGVDIFIMERIGPIVTYSDPYWRNTENGGEKCFYIYRYIFPLVPVRFGNFWMMAPFNAIEHLNMCYGTDWNSKSQTLFDHRKGKWINSKKKRMFAHDYLTVPAPKSTCELNPPKMKRCTVSVRASSNIKNLTDKELRNIGKIFGIPRYSSMKLSTLCSKIRKLV